MKIPYPLVKKADNGKPSTWIMHIYGREIITKMEEISVAILNYQTVWIVEAKVIKSSKQDKQGGINYGGILLFASICKPFPCSQAATRYGGCREEFELHEEDLTLEKCYSSARLWMQATETSHSALHNNHNNHDINHNNDNNWKVVRNRSDGHWFGGLVTMVGSKASRFHGTKGIEAPPTYHQLNVPGFTEPSQRLLVNAHNPWMANNASFIFAQGLTEQFMWSLYRMPVLTNKNSSPRLSHVPLKGAAMNHSLICA